MKKALFTALALLGIAGAVFSIVMLIMAIRFFEFGRVIFYAVLAIAGIEIAILSIIRLRKEIKK